MHAPPDKRIERSSATELDRQTANVDMIAIRPAELSEGYLLTELACRSKAHWGYSSEFIKSCRAELTVSSEVMANTKFSYFVAEEGDRLVGFYALQRISPIEFELEALFVEPARIGCGIGKALIEHAISWAREQGGQSMLIQGDPNAARFYEAAGAIRIGERESDSFPGRFLPEYRIQLCDKRTELTGMAVFCSGSMKDR